MSKVERIAVGLSAAMMDYVKEQAEYYGMSRSGFIAMCVGTKKREDEAMKMSAVIKTMMEDKEKGNQKE